MPSLSNAERQRLYRMRRDADPNRRVEYLAKKKVKYNNDIQARKRLKVGDMTPRQQRKQRRQWRSRQQASRQKQKTQISVVDENEVTSTTQASTPSTCRSNRGRKLVSRNRSALYKENIRLRETIQKCTTKMERYRKRLQRLRKVNTSVDSPRKATAAMMKRRNQSEIRKTLKFHHVLVAQIKDKYKQAKCVNSKRSIVSTVAGQIIRKYQLLNVLTSRVGCSKKIVMKVVRGTVKKQNERALSKDERKQVEDFYQREDVSRVCAGVKQTITRRGVKQQKHLLSDSVRNLFRRYVSEDGHRPISYSTFCKLRPFWVVPPVETDRETCLCYIHENVRHLVSALKNNNILETIDLKVLVAPFMCSDNSIECAYGECDKCKTPAFSFSRLVTDDTISFWRWETGTKTYTQNEQQKQVKITVKAMKKTAESEAIALFLSEMTVFKKHWYTMRKQFAAFRENKASVREDECIVHVDFSENFNCKFHNEVQAVHFGGSHAQASLHTVVLYTASSEPKCMCTVSECLDHGPAGIWAHLKPILHYIQKEYPTVQHLTFWSDGPSSQYKQKKNFFRFSTDPFDEGFRTVSWNFFESCHGKGAVDGVGATIKRIANEAVRQGKDVETPRKLFDVVTPLTTSVCLMYIDNDEFKSSADRMPEEVTVIPGTRSMHQINCTTKGMISHRRVSCFCLWSSLGDRMCPCYSPKTFSYSKLLGLREKRTHQPMRIALRTPKRKMQPQAKNHTVSMIYV